MSTITGAARSILKCALMGAFALSLAANATSIVSPVPPSAPKPTPKPSPKPKPYQTTYVQNNVTRAYEYRTRILVGKPGCQRYATEADAAFLDDKIDSATKVTLLKKIGAEAGASGCLAP